MVRERHRAGSRDAPGRAPDGLHPGLHPAARHSGPVFDRVGRPLPRRREAAQVPGLRRRADHAAMRRLAALVPVVTLFHGAVVGGADVVVLCPNALATAVSRVGDEHRAATGVGFRLVTDTAGGLASHAAAGTAGDVIISTTPAVADLEARGITGRGTRAEVGVIFIGVAVRKGSPMLDVSTSAALRRALLEARSIGYADPARGGTGGIIFARVLAPLRLADAGREKTRLVAPGTQALRAVSRGEAELGVSPVSEMVVREGLQMVGRLPADLGARPS